ncbi:MAG: S8 family peptidase [Gemmatimonadota bacterium]|nr:S8 family peptidase [Gemmatimonadota bacterium]
MNLGKDEIPEGFSEYSWTRLADGFYSLTVPVMALPDLGGDANVRYVEARRKMMPALGSSIGETRADEVHTPPAGNGFDGTGVIVGIIDYGLDFTLDDFRNADGSTRVAFLWDQGLTAASGESPPNGFSYGVEYDGASIDAALATTDPFSSVRHQVGESDHGTHVAGIAAGNGRSGDADFPAGDFVGAAPGSRIIFVQPSTTDQQTSFTDSVHVAEAIAYIFQKAADLGQPCVINMSLGQNGGSHDGESVVERGVDRMLDVPGRLFVLAAGNEHIWRGHASGTLQTGDTHSLQWKFGGELPLPGGGQLPPGFGDFTPNEMEVWYSSRDQLRVRVIDPNGDATSLVDPGDSVLETLPSGDEVFIDSERFTALNGDAQIYIEVSPGNSQLIDTGTWQVELTSIESIEGRFDAWIERDVRRPNNRFADQSFFVGADFDGRMTLGTPATCRLGVAVANYNHSTQSPNDSSSRGPTRDGRRKPEIAAPGTNILSSNSLGGRTDADGNTIPMRVSMSGTSMAAPHVTGIAALLLEVEADLTASQLRALLMAGATPVGGMVQPFDEAWGHGRVDAVRSRDLAQ